MLRSSVLAAMVLLVTGGCASTPSGRGDASGPQRVFYYAWSGVSPGADFTFTSVRAFEIDLAGRRIRGLCQSASAPDPMLPHEEEKITGLLDARPWRALSQDEVEGLRHFLMAWLKTDPPATYDEGHNLGTEDGYAERLTVYFAQGRRTTRINPRAGYSPDGKGLPPTQWRELLAAAMACAFGQRLGGIQPLSL